MEVSALDLYVHGCGAGGMNGKFKCGQGEATLHVGIHLVHALRIAGFGTRSMHVHIELSVSNTAAGFLLGQL